MTYVHIIEYIEYNATFYFFFFFYRKKNLHYNMRPKRLVAVIKRYNDS
jgi:hypothetical protein